MVDTSEAAWPELPYGAWRATRETLHMYLQIVGKVRLALEPMEDQWAQVPLYVTARGLNTSPVPHHCGVFDIDLDFIDHIVSVRTVAGGVESFRLEPRSVADFYAELMAALDRAGVPVEISPMPQEIPGPVPFPQDIVHASYEPEWANRYWRTLVSVDTVLKEHRARFRGKAAPVGLFWGSLDLSYSRFSGRLLDPPPEAGVIARYSADAEEVCAGFWPGDGRVTEPAFFAYALPKPPDVESAELTPAAAEWRASMGEFILPYEAVRTAPDPRQTLLGFLETTYRAGTADGDWPPELAQPSEG